jgi:hypothetical protein
MGQGALEYLRETFCILDHVYAITRTRQRNSQSMEWSAVDDHLRTRLLRSPRY